MTERQIRMRQCLPQNTGARDGLETEQKENLS